MYQKWVRKIPITKIAEELGISTKTVHKYKNKDEWESRKEREDKENRALAEVSRELIALNAEDIRNRSIKEIEMALYFRAKRIREAMERGDAVDGIAGELQKLASTLEKHQNVETKQSTGGVKRSEVHIKQEKIDWNEIIKLSIEARKQHGNNFDERKFIADAIKASTGDDNE